MIENFTPQPWPLLMSDDSEGDFGLLVIGWRQHEWDDEHTLCPVAVSATGAFGEAIEYQPKDLVEIRYRLPR